MTSCPSRDGYLLENAVLLFYELPVRVCPGLITPWVRHKIFYMLFAKFFFYFILLFEFRGAVVSFPPTFPRASGLNRSEPRVGHETAKLHPSGGYAI